MLGIGILGTIVIVQASTASNTMSHTNKAAYIASQWGGHFSLGSRTTRNQVQRAQVASVQLPSINADCGGIDAFLGGFHFINSQQFIDMAKNIGSSAKSFAFMLAMETVSPMIATGLKYLQNAAQMINSANINSCEGAAALIGSVVPSQSKLANHSCRLMASHKGHISDFVSGLKKCGEGGDARSRVRGDMAREYPDTFHEEFNVAWMVLNKHPLWGATKTDYKQLMMSITGTIISDGRGGYRVYEPLVLDDQFFHNFAQGGTVKFYRCGDTGRCLTISEGNKIITKDDTHAARIQDLIKSIEGKVRDDQPLNAEEINLITDSQLPILKIINVMSAYHKGACPIDLMSYADVIAHDVLIKHMKEIIDVVRHLAQGLQRAQMNDAPLKKYMNNLRAVEKKLEQREIENNQRLDQIFMLIKRTLVLEKAIYAKMRAFVKE